MADRLCGDPACTAVLSRYNRGDRCSLHEAQGVDQEDDEPCPPVTERSRMLDDLGDSFPHLAHLTDDELRELLAAVDARELAEQNVKLAALPQCVKCGGRVPEALRAVVLLSGDRNSTYHQACVASAAPWTPPTK